ncbi:MAG: SAM-dependent chlorinase/fluorinase [Planctomycetota bacterium]
MAAAHGGARDGWRASGIVSLITDFGTADPYGGIVKGVLFARAPHLRAVVDVTHEIPPQDVELAAFHLAQAWRHFPAGTVHAAIVDPGVGTARAMLLVEAEGHAVLAPDNGLVGPLLAAALRPVVRRVDPARFRPAGASRTFHGRDRFAPAAALLVEGAPPADLGPAVESFARPSLSSPVLGPDGALAARVLFADRFGNLITDAPAAGLGGPPEGFEAVFAGGTARHAATYAEAAPGEAIFLESSYGLLEIAVRGGSAAAVLGLGRGAAVSFRPRPAAPPDSYSKIFP